MYILRTFVRYGIWLEGACTSFLHIYSTTLHCNMFFLLSCQWIFDQIDFSFSQYIFYFVLWLQPSGWRKLRNIVQWTPFFQTYKKQRYPWVQLAGHQGNFKAGPDQGTVLKKLCPKEELCFHVSISLYFVHCLWKLVFIFYLLTVYLNIAVFDARRSATVRARIQRPSHKRWWWM